MIDINTPDDFADDIFSTTACADALEPHTSPSSPATTPPSGDATPPARRPSPFDDVVGQKTAVELLRRIAEGIAFGAEPDPILLLGPSGKGKTLLASRFARALSMPLIVIICGREVTPAAFIEKIAGQSDPAVVFLDEAHSLPKRTMETCFQAIDEARLPALKDGKADRTSAPEPIARHVWVAASNLPGGILRALRSRLMTVALADYSIAELELFASRRAEGLGIVLPAEGIAFAARACGGSPRTLGHILNTIAVTTTGWRYEQDYLGNDPTIPLETVEEVAALMGIDGLGLDATGRALLAALARQPALSASAETLSVAAGLDLPYVRERLADLRHRGLVTAAPGRGWRIAAHSNRTWTT